MAKRVKIPGRLESAETGNIVTGADAVMDDEKGKTQVVINSEVDAAIISLAQGKQDALTFDSAPTEGSPNPVTSAGVYTADKVLSDAIEAILLLIPSAASALNKLVDMQTMNSSIATATASFKGTYNLVSDLHLGVDATHEQIGAALDVLSLGADNNDYAFVQVPNSATAQTEIRVTERYKFNGTNWLFEYDLNNSGFTQGQWNAINSGVTSLLVGKLSDLPTNAELTTLLTGKQDNLTFDNVPTAGSPNPVKSGGVYARNNEIVALINALDAAKQDVLTFDNAPVEGSPNPVKSGGVYTAISAVQAAIVALDAEKQNVLTFDSTPKLGSANPVMSSGIKTELNRIDGNIMTLNDLYEALTQSALVIVQPSDTWPVASPASKTIYRVVDRVNTPPQYYSDYMFRGNTPVLMATYDNAIDDEPIAGSSNLVKSGGVFNGKLINDFDTFQFAHFVKKDFTVENTILLQTGLTSPFDGYYTTPFIEIPQGIKYINTRGLFIKAASYCGLAFYDSNKNVIETYGRTDTSTVGFGVVLDSTLANAKYIRACTEIENAFVSFCSENTNIDGLLSKVGRKIKVYSTEYFGSFKKGTVFKISYVSSAGNGLAFGLYKDAGALEVIGKVYNIPFDSDYITVDEDTDIYLIRTGGASGSYVEVEIAVNFFFGDIKEAKALSQLFNLGNLSEYGFKGTSYPNLFGQDPDNTIITIKNSAAVESGYLKSITVQSNKSGSIKFAIGIIDQRNMMVASKTFFLDVESGINDYDVSDLSIFVNKGEQLFAYVHYYGNDGANITYIGAVSQDGIEHEMLYNPDDYPLSRLLTQNGGRTNLSWTIVSANSDVFVTKEELRTEQQNTLAEVDNRIVRGTYVYDENGTPYKIIVRNGSLAIRSVLYTHVHAFGNSLTDHGYKPEIGWYGGSQWAMAATTLAMSWGKQLERILKRKNASAAVTTHDIYSLEANPANYISQSSMENYLLPMFNGDTPDLVIFHAGENVASVNYANFESALQTFVDCILSAFPNCTIMLCSQFWPNIEKDAIIQGVAESKGVLFQTSVGGNYKELLGDMGLGKDDNVTLYPIVKAGVASHMDDYGFFVAANAIGDFLSYEPNTDVHNINVSSSIGYRLNRSIKPAGGIVTILFQSVSAPTVTATDGNNNSVTVQITDMSNVQWINTPEYLPTFVATFVMPDSDVNVTVS